MKLTISLPTFWFAATSDDIPTLEIETLQTAGPGHARRSGKNTSNRIVTVVTIALLLAVGIPYVIGASSRSADTVSENGSSRQRDLPTPSLVLLAEASRTLAPNVPGAQLLKSTTKLLGAGELPDAVTIDFVLQSLRTVQLANADNRVPRQRLESFTRRLADAARAQSDQGNSALASRLIEQASTSGVAVDYVRRAADYVASPASTGQNI